MFSELVSRIREYQEKGYNFAIAQVIDREAPSSCKIGDKALILETGALIGWIGGGCVKGIVIKEALDAIKTKRYRRVHISPHGGTSTSDQVKNYIMSCQSEGTVEVLIEPIYSQPELIVVGKSEIARKLVAMAAAAGLKVCAMAVEGGTDVFPSASLIFDKVDFHPIKNFKNSYIIVATQGEDDEESVLKAFETPANYIGFVASKKKAAHVKEYLANQGISKSRIQKLKSPVGLNINAKLASEVAISILADIISDFRNKPEMVPSETQPAPEKDEGVSPGSVFSEEYYINPVCNVPVSKKSPKHIIEYRGEKVYFCCDGCKVSFEKNPEQYMSKTP